ncbi:MAG: hypothetical protein RQ862_11835 [Candidatus Caldarchaeales archaeon]|nr:hypothetical protein [Candidatus Caldarchaeales archaeon]
MLADRQPDPPSRPDRARPDRAVAVGFVEVAGDCRKAVRVWQVVLSVAVSGTSPKPVGWTTGTGTERS